jgi:hypothetical protein
VVNAALSYIGVRNFITSINEDSVEAIVAKVHYARCTAVVLGERWWNFAEASASLARLAPATQPSGFSFTYQLPADLLPGKTRYINPGARLGRQRSRDAVPFALRWVASQGQVLLTDHEAPELFYTRNVTELVYWPEKASDAIAWCLAPALALGINVDLRKGINFAEQYRLALDGAMAEDMNSVRRDPPLTSDLQSGRG